MRRRDHGGRGRLLGLAAAAFALSAVAAPAVVAQTGEPPDTSQFGGYTASSRGSAVQLTYDSPGLLPVGSPILGVTVPEALATLNSGNGYAMASFAFPGPLVADLGAVLELAGMASGVPPYPIRTEAFHPAGPATATEGAEGTEMTSTAEAGNARAVASYAALDVPPAVSVGGMRSNAQSTIEGDQVVSRSRSEVSDVVLLGGLVTIESVITDVVATTNAADGASAGGTRVSGVRVLGIPAVLDSEGIRFADDGAPDPSANPVGGPLQQALGPLAGPVRDAVGQLAGPLDDLLTQVRASGDDALQQLFDASGIEIRLLDPAEALAPGAADRTANGVSVTVNYDGANTPVLTELLSLVPSSDLPAENLGPIPFSPQGLFNLLKETHIVGFSLAPASASAKATPAFEADLGDIDIDVPGGGDLSLGGTGTGSGSFDLGPGGGGGFETATPELAAPAPDRAVPASSSGLFPGGTAVPALAALGLALGIPFFAAGSRRLADATLAATATSCPAGLDAPVPPEDRP